MRKILYLFIFITLITLSACSTETTSPNPDIDDDQEMIYLTLEQLAEFDGKEGRNAYIAVDGKIYDVTNSPRWPNGNHNGFQAGQDLTDPILNTSPHGIRTLDNIPLIGYLILEDE
jgi:predicted heme/steroid binding protein